VRTCANGGEALLAPIGEVHLVDRDDHVAHPEQPQEREVAARLLLGAGLRIDDEERGRGVGRAGHEVAQQFAVPGRIDDQELAARRAHAHARGVERDRLVALELECVEHERPLERHTALLGGGLQRLDLAVGQEVELVQQPSEQRRLAVVDVAGDANRHGGEIPPKRASLASPRGAGALGRPGGAEVGFVRSARRHHMYPAARSRSNASSRSWSIARPARSSCRVVSSSAMISAIDDALEVTGEVMSFSPSDRKRLPPREK